MAGVAGLGICAHAGRRLTWQRACTVPPSMSDRRPRLFWFRRDLRLADNPGLAAAAASGGPVIPVFVLDPETEALGAAPLWRLGLSVERLAKDLAEAGGRLVLRRGPAAETIAALAREAGAAEAHWSLWPTPEARARDEAAAAALRAAGVEARSHPGHLLHEPETLANGTGRPYRVFTPFWRAVAARPVAEPLPAPRLPAPEAWPRSEALEAWGLARRMNRGAAVVARHLAVGERAARDRLGEFLETGIGDYAGRRDRPDQAGTSRLSENLAYGEISARTVWVAAGRAWAEGAAGAEAFCRELVWREFAWHLACRTPHILDRNWREGWDAFPWRGENPDLERWRRGTTGEPMVDAGMREMWVTGRMHNRVRMVAASYLCKHLMTHWRQGAEAFADCLVDWDPASNALGWQWVAGSGPDAAPYFRIFNPETQAARFDPDGAYRRRFLLGWDGGGGREARSFFEATPRRWGLRPDAPYPQRLAPLKEGRERALAAYRAHVAAARG
jgi:deoxyribodipyrimidine photo-lyase